MTIRWASCDFTARIDRATRAEWEVWRKQAADAYVERGDLPGPWGYDYPDNMNANNPDIGRYAAFCHGYRRLKVTESMRAKLRALWPADRPRFWALPNEEDMKIRSIISDPNESRPPGIGSWAGRYGSPSESTSGLPIRSGRTVGRPPHLPTRWPTETYPFVWPPVLAALPLVVSQAPADTYVQKADLRDGALNGFATCQNRNDLFRPLDPLWQSKRHVFAVDEHVVRVRQGGSIHLLRPLIFIERDESVFIFFLAHI
jgi:hypothetical protein